MATVYDPKKLPQSAGLNTDEITPMPTESTPTPSLADSLAQLITPSPGVTSNAGLFNKLLRKQPTV